MLPVLPRGFRLGAATIVLAGVLAGALPVLPLPHPLAHLLGVAPALAQEAAPAEAEAPGKKRRRGREKKAAVTAPGMQQATPVAIFGDWNVFANGQGKTRVCYAIAQPQVRSPKTLKRDTAYLFVTVRKAENVANEVAVMLGFPAKPASSQSAGNSPKANAGPAPTDPTLNLGATRYGLVTKDNNAWLQNPAEEARVVAEMARTPKLLVKTTSMRGNPTQDDYALAGFGEAMKRAREECK
ncbi:invasion associated locus b family protein [Methylobacterium sp. J-068]|uniref:invasion associated locus b family protein n=1 Tax=Methylobacterium sp. J-068 TaxID=2836649 RepID=UPI001FB9F020|nr:invasion associated locus b family protein [Methylobacterium sp. J-068]MCJ2036361.1 invasion associated locus b family protein [Methylobacterium sp. J-068]